MQPSIIQLLEMHFLGIKVWPRPSEELEEQDIASFDFNGVEIGEIADTQLLNVKDDPLVYGVILRIVIENKGGKIAPYDIDVCVYGHFKISKNVPKEKRENLVAVNGCSMLYGAIREQVMTLSARSIHGMLMLPTASFKDKIKENADIPQNNKSTRSTRSPKKKTSG